MVFLQPATMERRGDKSPCVRVGRQSQHPKGSARYFRPKYRQHFRGMLDCRSYGAGHDFRRCGYDEIGSRR